jgi:hypothetical protein
MTTPTPDVTDKSMKRFIGKKIKSKVKFMDSELEISKLTIAQVTRIQELAKEAEKDQTKGFGIMQEVIKMSAVGAEELTPEDFESMPLEELTKLSDAIMKFSGLETKVEAGK